MSCLFENGACIGFHYLRHGEWEQAEKYLEWAIDIHKSRNNVAAIGACYIVYGSLRLSQKKYPKAVNDKEVVPPAYGCI